MTEDLTEWLREVLVEDRKKVEECRDNPLILASLGTEDAGAPWIPDPVEVDALRKDLEMAMAADARLMVHHFAPEIVDNTAFVLADIEAKLAILDFAERSGDPNCGCRDAMAAMDQTVRLLASAYRARPGYQEEWRP